MATDTAFYRNPHYHTSEDTADKLSYPELARATDGLARTFAALADELEADLTSVKGFPQRV